MDGLCMSGQHNGPKIDLTNPRWQDIRLASVARSLSRLPRFLGHTSRVITVLEHSFAVAVMVPPQYRLAALLHDAHEAFIGDMPRPARAAIDLQSRLGYRQGDAGRESASMFSGRPGPTVAIESISSGLDRAIALAALGMAPGVGSQTMHHAAAAVLAAEMRGEAVRMADDLACEIEIRCFTDWRPEQAPFEDWPHFYSRLLPDGDALQLAWLDCVEALAIERFGGEANRPAAASWLWG